MSGDPAADATGMAIVAALEASGTADLVPWLRLDPDARITGVGTEFAEIAGLEAESMLHQHVGAILAPGEAEELATLCVADRGRRRRRLLTVSSGGRRITLRACIQATGAGAEIVAVPHPDQLGFDVELHTMSNELAVLSRSHQRQAEELAQALAERDRSYWHLEKLQEVLPICMDCGTVKAGDWMSVVDYLRSNSVSVSHGVCEGCFDRRMAELDGAEHGGEEGNRRDA